MNISGQSFINGKWIGEQGQNTFYAYHPAENAHSQTRVFCVTPALIELATSVSGKAFVEYRQVSATTRADFLDEIANQLLEIGERLITVTHQETGLPVARLEGERGRTINQLRAFASHIRERDITLVEPAEPQRSPLPKPVMIRSELPLGPVAVFGASNFPYAFSTAGGDTASALAAGCPVIVKGHPAHPLTSELTARAIEIAMQKHHIPMGSFQLIQGYEPAISHQLVRDKHIKAVGFTGSHAVASGLQSTINQREEPIPLYGELGSVNPQFVLPGMDENQQRPLAETLVQSLLMGNGQFCTSPGIWFVPEDNSAFLTKSKNLIQNSQSDTLLTQGILDSYLTATDSLALNDKLTNLAQGKLSKHFHATGMLFSTDIQTFIKNKQLHQEIFGPCALIVTYQDTEQLLLATAQLNGQLTASVYADETTLSQHLHVIEKLQYKVGRLIFNQPPTGVEVCPGMHHGGPYPSSTDVRHTSVGLHAIDRFLRPICYQNPPDVLSRFAD